jgi:hypothetical protein
MGMLLKCIGLWLLITWHKENLLVLCNDNNPQSFSLPIASYHEPKPVITDASASISPRNDIEKLQKEIDQLTTKEGCSIFIDAVVTNKNISSEHLESMEAGGGVTIRPNISCRDEFLILNKTLSDLLTKYRDSFPAISHDNRTSNTKVHKVVIDEPKDIQSSSLPSGKQNTTPEYTENMEDDGGMTLNPEIILLDATSNFNEELSDLSKSYYEIVPAIGHDNRPSSTKAQKGVIYEQNGPRSSRLPSGKQNTPRDDSESMEDGGGMTLEIDMMLLDATSNSSTELSDLSKYYYEIVPAIGQENRPSNTKSRRGVEYEPQIVPQEGVDLNVLRTSSNLDRTDENIGNENTFRLNKTSKLAIIKRSDDDYSEFWDTIQIGKDTSDSVSSECDTVEALNDLPQNINLLSQSPPLSKDSNTRNHIIGVVLVASAALVVIVFAVFLYKKYSEFWKWSHLRYYGYNTRMDNLLDDMYDA